MNYFKLLIPIPIAIALIFSAIPLEQEYPEYNLIIGSIVRGGLMIYYLRLGNSGTPLINSLTLIVLVIILGEYFFNNKVIPGQIIFVIANIPLGIVYFIRQKLKTNKDKMAGIKTAAVFMFSLTDLIIVFFNEAGVAPRIIGFLFLSAVYFYDRLIRIGELKNYRQHSV